MAIDLETKDIWVRVYCYFRKRARPFLRGQAIFLGGKIPTLTRVPTRTDSFYSAIYSSEAIESVGVCVLSSIARGIKIWER